MSKRLSVILALALASTATAQDALERFERQLEQIQRDTLLRVDTSVPTEQRSLLDFGAWVGFSVLAIDDPNQETHILRQTDLTYYARVNLDNAHEFFVRGHSQYRDFNSGDSFSRHGDMIESGDDLVEAELERAYYRFDLRQYLASYEGLTSDWNATLTGGRQLVQWANGLTLSQVIDGATLRVGTDRVWVEALAGRTWGGSFDIDSSRPGFDGDTHRDFFGGSIHWQWHELHRVFFYALAQQDRNEQDFNPDPLLDLRLDGNPGVPVLPTRYQYDSYYLGAGASGSISDRWLYSVEAVFEGGSTLSNSFQIIGGVATPIQQTEDDVQAWALDARVDYLHHDANRSRGVIELILASGDDDRGHASNTFNGNQPGTKDRGFNGFGLLYTGLAFSPDVSNLFLTRLGASTFPLPGHDWFDKLQVGANLFIYNKLDPDAPIDESTRDRHFLGVGFDAFANWQATSDVSLSIRYGVFLPGQAIETDHDARHFLFTGVTYAF
jgi:hypothetical protein